MKTRGVHGDKLVATRNNSKLPRTDVQKMDEAIGKYDEWISKLSTVTTYDLEKTISIMVGYLNEYKLFIDYDLIFNNENDFLYRQKGQLKLDNTVMEEFLPILVKKCLDISEIGITDTNLVIAPQVSIYSSINFTSSLREPSIGAGLQIRTKNQDFSMSRVLYIKSSYNQEFHDAETLSIKANIGYIMAELKTNLDKTMFQEASATAHDIKLAVTGAKYYLLCDYLDMKPISTSVTDIDEILILRKVKRINSNIRDEFNTYEGRVKNKEFYLEYLRGNPYSTEVFTRFIMHILEQFKTEDSLLDNVIKYGYF
jgi:hypothetical protein